MIRQTMEVFLMTFLIHHHHLMMRYALTMPILHLMMKRVLITQTPRTDQIALLDIVLCFHLFKRKKREEKILYLTPGTRCQKYRQLLKRLFSLSSKPFLVLRCVFAIFIKNRFGKNGKWPVKILFDSISYG